MGGYTKAQINDLYERIVKDIDISNDLFDDAETEYNALGQWIDKETPTYKIGVYAQGSFALGTVIKPLTGTDDYDLDLVCEFAEQYGLTAEELKCSVVKPLLQRYRKTRRKIQNKRRCWHVEYEDVPKFHMDVVPAVFCNGYIKITDHNEDNDTYEYIGSNPKGYIDWFRGRMDRRRKIIREQYCKEHKDIITCQADIEKLKEYHYKTPLQKAIQLLKRHRDIMFQNDENNRKPISIIITTIAAELYNNEDNIFDTLCSFLLGAEKYITSHMNHGEYYIKNPSYTGGTIENFADKWNEHAERAESFKNWIQQAKSDLIDEQLFNFTRLKMAENIKKSMGEITQKRVFSTMAEEERKSIGEQHTKVNPVTGSLSLTGSIPVSKNHHFGK